MPGTGRPPRRARTSVRLPDGLIDSLQEGLLVLGPYARVIDANDAACRLLGITRTAALGTFLAAIDLGAVYLDGSPMPDSERPSAVAARTGHPHSAVFGVRQDTEHPLWLRVSAIPLTRPRRSTGEHADPTEPTMVVTMTDVTAEIVQAAALRHSEEHFRLTFEDAAIGMAVVSLDGRFLDVNRALLESLGMSREDLLTRSFQTVTHPDDLSVDVEHAERLVAGVIPSYQVEKRYLTSAGATIWARVTVGLVRDGRGRPTHFVSQVEDVTAMRRAQDLLERRAMYDHLTGLANRSLLIDRLTHALVQHAERDTLVAVAFVDLDHFKLVNDSLGHDAGDRMLRVVADRMSTAVRPGDTVARIGGDEFVLVLEHVDSAEHAGELLQRVLTAVERPLRLSGHDLVPRVSAGLTVDDGSGTAERVLRDSDTALYVAKDAGRARWEMFHDTFRRDALHRLSLEGELRASIRRGEFVLHYQPIVDLTTREVVAHEALVRWQHPERGLLLPDEFIGVAEEADLIGALGSWVLREAVGFLARRPELPGRVYINVSPRQIGRTPGSTGGAAQGLASTVARTLAERGVPPHRLGIEITESGVLEASEAAREDLARLSALGVALVLDDFGTGYSALSSVLSAPIEGLKLDRSFTVRLGDGGACDRISTAIAALVDSLATHGVVEGIETEEQRVLAIAHGWRHGQGWLFGRAAAEAATTPG